jgi:predicted acetyltransferase
MPNLDGLTVAKHILAEEMGGAPAKASGYILSKLDRGVICRMGNGTAQQSFTSYIVKRKMKLAMQWLTEGMKVSETARSWTKARKIHIPYKIVFAKYIIVGNNELNRGLLFIMEPIRPLKHEELEDSFTLSEFAFQYTLSPEDKAERLTYVKPEETLGFFVDNRLAAKLTIHELETWINGKPYAMGGIASVATWPEYRRQGMVGQLLAAALNKMREKGQTISFLAPFSFAFYRKYGWETYVSYNKYEITADKLPKWQAPEGSRMTRVEADWKLLSPIYEAYAQAFNGMLGRTELWWRTRIFKTKKGIVTMYISPDGVPEGYIFYQVKDRVFTIHELVALNEDARQGIWKFIADHDSMIEKVVCQGPSDDQLPFLLAEPRIKQEIIPYFMARIVDVQMFLQNYSFDSDAQGGHRAEPFYLAITDSQAAWNHGLFKVSVATSGHNEIMKLSDEPRGDSHSDYQVLSCDIQSLTALLMGYKRIAQLLQIGRLQGNPKEAARLDRIIPTRTTYLTDYF